MYLSWCKNVEEHYYVDSKIWKFSLYLWAAFGIILKLLLLCGWDIFIVSCWVDRRIEEKLNENRDMASKVASNRPVVPKWIVRGSGENLHEILQYYENYDRYSELLIISYNFFVPFIHLYSISERFVHERVIFNIMDHNSQNYMLLMMKRKGNSDLLIFFG